MRRLGRIISCVQSTFHAKKSRTRTTSHALACGKHANVGMQTWKVVTMDGDLVRTRKKWEVIVRLSTWDVHLMVVEGKLEEKIRLPRSIKDEGIGEERRTQYSPRVLSTVVYILLFLSLHFRFLRSHFPVFPFQSCYFPCNFNFQCICNFFFAFSFTQIHHLIQASFPYFIL